MSNPKLGEKLARLRLRLWGVTGQERAVLWRCLATTLGSGVGLDRSLNLLSEQTMNPDLAAACRGMTTLVCSGHQLSEAMQRYPWAFGPFHRRLVQVGESSGSLVQVLLRLSQSEERQLKIALRIRSALVTPLIVCGLCILIAIIIPPILFKPLFEMLQETHTALPWPTQILIGFSQFLQSWLCWILLALAPWTAYGLYQKVVHQRHLQLKLYGWLFAVPYLGKCLRLIAVCRFLYSLETTLRVGLPILSCLDLAALAGGNPILEDAVKIATQAVRDGEELHEALSFCGFFPGPMIQSVEVGEQSGKLTDMLESLCKLYGDELEANFEMLAASVEPLILALIGAVVGFTVIATMLPLVKVIENL